MSTTGNMSTVRKFLFDNCFDDPAGYEIEEEDEYVEPPPPTFSEEELAAARTEAFVEGRNEGIAEMQTAIDRKVGEVMEGLHGELQQLGSAHRARIAEIEHRMLTLAGAIARKVVPAIARDHAEHTVEAVIRDCLPKLMDEPRIVVRVHATLLERLREKVDTLAARSGYPGHIILLADDALAEADCRVEWADGGAEKSHGEIWAAIDTALNTHLAAPSAAPAVPGQRHDAEHEPPPPASDGTEPGETELNEENPNG